MHTDNEKMKKNGQNPNLQNNIMCYTSHDHGRRLLQRETFWIYYLNTMSPNGLNEEFDIKPFL